MKWMPNDIAVKFGIQQGSVYNFSPSFGVDNHYFIVLNRNPREENEIYLARFTTKKEKIQAFIKSNGLSPKTFIEIHESECKFLPRPSETCINCNYYHPLASLDVLISLIEGSKGSPYPCIGKDLMARIVDGFMASRMIALHVKVVL